MSRILNGRPVADAIIAEAARRAEALRSRGVMPALALMRVGTGGGEAGASYERLAVDVCNAAGVEAYCAYLPDIARLQSNLDNINNDPAIHGAIFMRPLPDDAGEDLLRRGLNPFKDVDGVTLSSLAAVFVGHGEAFVPCPAKAVMELLDYYGVELEGRRVMIMGRTLMVGKPLSMLLLERNATVTLCHSLSPDAAELCRGSDVIVCGVPGILDAGCFRSGQTVLDVGDSLMGERRSSTIDVEAALAAGADVSPAADGVSDVSFAVLALHTVQAAELQNGIDPAPAYRR